MFVHGENQVASTAAVNEVIGAITAAFNSECPDVPKPANDDESSGNVKYPWEQRDDEPDKEYNAFRIFSNLGTGRSYGKAALESGFSKQTIFRWAKKFDWINRIECYKRTIALEAKQSIMNSNSDYILRAAKSNLYLAKRATAVVEALVPFLEMFYMSYNNTDAKEKLRYIILACRAIKEVKSLVNYNPLSSRKESFDRDAMVMHFIEEKLGVIDDSVSDENLFDPDRICETQYDETFADSLRRPDFRKSFWNIDADDRRQT